MADKSPDAFRTISEVADWLGVQPHVLRFWESKFSQVKPVKRAGGRRYYRPNDMLLLGGIRKLLHEDGLTIKGAQKVLREQGMAHVSAMSQPLDDEAAGIVEDADAARDIPEAPFTEAPSETAEVADFAQHAAASAPQEPQAPVADPAPMVEAAAPEPVEHQPSFDGMDTELPAPDVEEPAPEVVTTDPQPAETPVEAAPVEHAAQAAPDYEDFSSADNVIPNVEPEPKAEPEPVAEVPAEEPVQLDAFPEDPAPAEPEITQDPEPMAEAPVAASEVPLDAPSKPEPVAAADVATADASPRPNIIDAPDPDESSIPVAPAALSTAFQLSAPDAATRASLAPLVAQLAALRDKMAATSGR